MEELTADDRQKLKDSLSDLTKSGPKTQLAESRFKRIMNKVGKESADAMRGILVDVVSETVKKSLYGT